jgi:MarR family transcriptional regulator, organic hydroperoxide resistance regulator
MDIEHNFGRYIGRIHYLLSRKLTQLNEESGSGITADQFRLLTHLWNQDGITQQSLAQLLGRDRASVTRMVDILEEQGVLKRIADRSDRRVKRIVLTREGKLLKTKAYKAAGKSLEVALKGISKADQIVLMSHLKKVIHNLKS